jgi:phosphate transport system protein
VSDVVGVEVEAFDDMSARERVTGFSPSGDPLPEHADVRPALHRAVDTIVTDLVGMAGRVGDALGVCAAALRDQPADLAAVVAADPDVDAVHHRVRGAVLDVLTTQAPLARDLRRVVASLLVDEELERMGDHCVSVAHQCTHVAAAPPATRDALASMAGLCAAMVDDTAGLIGSPDGDAARTLAARDAGVYSLYHPVIDNLLEGAGGADAATGPAVVLVAYHLERIGDRVTNIAEHLVFAAEGTHVDLG